eukprot:TRINITY_DN35000_c0_g1_i3.p1 TRINITY_DN35000_c0_g1~~TRINITY_DN35000_c0_g1_i3.p1  ORF type:complete len:164 (+),score=28.20 TRINITY_DN35000_c0_g1_i3:88-579(+)
MDTRLITSGARYRAVIFWRRTPAQITTIAKPRLRPPRSGYLGTGTMLSIRPGFADMSDNKAFSINGELNVDTIDGDDAGAEEEEDEDDEWDQDDIDGDETPARRARRMSLLQMREMLMQAQDLGRLILGPEAAQGDAANPTQRPAGLEDPQAPPAAPSTDQEE